MRIRCERCQAQYDIDDSQFRGGRLEVQCSVCAHVFMVSQPGNSPSPSPAPREKTWDVRTADGRIQRFASLTDVQRGVQEGRLTPYDQVTRDQLSWLSLAEVAELAPMFKSMAASRAGIPSGCAPQELAIANETSRYALEPNSHGILKVSVGLAVAAGVAFAGIRWQQDRNLHFQSKQAHAAMPAVTRSAASSPSAQTAAANQAGLEPTTEPEPKRAPRQTAQVEALPSPPQPVAKKEAPAAPVAHPAESYDKLVAEADRTLENGGNSRARELYQKALNLRPTGFKAIAGLGFVALDRGQLPAAYDYFKRALTCKTSYPPALFGIAEVHRARGEKSLALHSYQRYLDMAPDGTDAPAARRQLQNLQASR